MASLGNLYFKIGADVKEAVKGIDQVKNKVEDIRKLSIFSGALQGANAAIGVFNSIVSAIKPLVQEFDNAAKSAAKLETALKGNKIEAGQLIQQANKLSQNRLFPADQTVNAQATLAALGLTKNAILQLTPAIQDFASAQKIDLSSAAQAVGKAITSGGEALKKYGVTLKEAKTPTERFKEVIKGLTEAFGGQAQEAAKVGAGPLQLLEQRFSAIKEKAGESLVAFVNQLLPIANEGVTQLTETLQALPKYAENVGKAIVATLKPFKDAYNNILTLDTAFGGPLQKLQKLIQSFAGIEQAGANAGRRIGGTLWSELDTNLGKLKGTTESTGKEFIRIKDSFSGFTFEVERTNKSIARSLFIQDQQNLLLDANNKVINEVNKSLNEQYEKQVKNNLVLLDANALSKANTQELQDNLKAKQALALFEARLNAIQRDKTRAPIAGLEPPPGESIPEVIKGLSSSQIESLGNIFQTDGVEAYKTALSEVNTSMETTKQILAGIGEQAAQAFSGLALSLIDGSLAFKDLGRAALDAADQIVKAALAAAIAAAISGSLKNPNILVGLALAAVAIAVVKRLFKQNVPKLAGGGLAYRPQLAVVGDNPNAASDPEVISPLSKLNTLLANQINNLAGLLTRSFNQSIQAVFAQPTAITQPQSLDFRDPLEIVVNGKIEGSDIRLAYDRAASVRNRHLPKPR